MVIRTRDFFLASNLLSIARVVLTAPIVYLIALDNPANHLLLFIITFVAASTDFLDGYLSRKLNQVTDLGILLDPIADKIGMAAIFLALIIFREFPLPLVVLLLYRDLMIIILGAAVLRKTQTPVMANFLGKLNTNVVALACILYMFHIENAFFIFTLWCSYLVILISGISYYRIGEKLLVESPAAKWLFRIGILGLTSAIVYLLIVLQLPWMPA